MSNPEQEHLERLAAEPCRPMCGTLSEFTGRPYGRCGPCWARHVLALRAKWRAERAEREVRR